MSSAATSRHCVTARVPAKVNLELMVGPRRADGFHHLATVFQAVGLHDDVSVEPADDWGITVNGPYAEMIAHMFETSARKLGLWERRAHDGSHAEGTTFTRPAAVAAKGPQLTLF